MQLVTRFSWGVEELHSTIMLHSEPAGVKHTVLQAFLPQPLPNISERAPSSVFLPKNQGTSSLSHSRIVIQDVAWLLPVSCPYLGSSEIA